MTRDEEDRVLGRVLRRFMDDEDNWTSTNGAAGDADLILDGHVELTPAEGAVVFRVLGHDTSGVRA